MPADDDDLDLAAWEAPPPPAGIADAVIARARMGEREVTAVFAPTSAVAAPDAMLARGTRRRWFAIGALAVTAAAAAAVAIAWLVRSDDDIGGTGYVATAKPSHVELGASAADLEPATDLWWVRDRHRITAMQPRGTATWKVASGDTLVIDAGATVASVEASGASLRVEVSMNLSDARVIGATAMTAAAVAFVTVVVYEGHVKVTGSDHTVVAGPGDVVAVGGGGNGPLVVQRDPRDTKIDALEAELQRLEAQLRDDSQQDKTSDIGTGPCQADALVAKGDELVASGSFQPAIAAYEAALYCKPDASVEAKAYVAACQMKFITAARKHFQRLPAARQPAAAQVCIKYGIDPRGVDIATLGTALAPVESQIRACSDGSFSGVATARFEVQPDGTIATVAIVPADVAFAPCIARIVKSVKLPATTLGAPAEYSWQLTKTKTEALTDPKPTQFDFSKCDPSAVQDTEDRADASMGRGNYAAALAGFEQILRCKPSLFVKVFMVACHSHQFAKARKYFRGFPKDKQDYLAQICMKDGFDPRTGVGGETGTLRITSMPAAIVVIDGDLNDRRKTPATFEVDPGKHKVTYLIGQDKMTFSATVKVGETVTLHKDLQ